MSVDALYLNPGTVVNPPYQVARVLGYGGFGITYLGWDANLQIKVAIKEYMPREFAGRDPQTGHVLANAGEAGVQFSAGLNRFLDEARTLAKFQQHPGIVSVLSFFPAFGTGYMVMEYVEGQTLKGYLDQRGRLAWTQTLDIFMQIMDALRAVHKAGLLHRDIAPDNIYLCGDGRVKLLDFGAAQASLSGSGQPEPPRTVLVKSGFAPEEQYQDDSRQGPWTDVYSLAASMYFCLAGQAPPDALDRLKQDRLKPLADYGVMIPPLAEQVLLEALAVHSLQRPQSIETLQKQFIELQSKPVSVPPANISVVKQAPQPPLVPLPGEQRKSGQITGLRWLLTAAIAVILTLILFSREQGKPTTLSERESLSKHLNPPIEPVQPDDAEPAQQRLSERQAAEALKQRQEAALQRFEERRRQEFAVSVPPVKQTDSQQSEHIRSLCAEWGATMECLELRKNQ
jgi:serine/threonine protein kinase